MANVVEFRGIREWEFMMDNLHPKIKYNISRKVFRKAGLPLIRQEKANAASISNRLKKSIGYISPKTAPNANTRTTLRGSLIIGIGPRVNTGKNETDGWFAHFYEYGAKGILKNKPRNTTSANPDFKFVGRIYKKGDRYRVDLPPKPFIRPAIDSTMGQVKAEIKDTIGKVIESEVRRWSRRIRRYEDRRPEAVY
jgi:hypothetical protein